MENPNKSNGRYAIFIPPTALQVVIIIQDGDRTHLCLEDAIAFERRQAS